MNAKQCVYKNCGNTSAFTKITFFSFPLKDAEKCRVWAQRAGCEGINLRNKFLCENHFSTIYISKTPRRTVLLPNALPLWAENLNESYEQEFHSEKNTSEDEILLEQLNDENEIIYTDTMEIIRQTDAVTDDNALDDVIIDDEMNSVNAKITLNAASKVAKSIEEKTIEPIINRMKKVQKIEPPNRISLPNDGKFINHVTKRQKLQTSIDNIIVSNHIEDGLKVEEKPDGGDDDDKAIQVDNTIDNPDITTFIYKGEEYIQMPKRIYLQQRIKLDSDVKRYRSIVRNIKSLVNSTD